MANAELIAELQALLGATDIPQEEVQTVLQFAFPHGSWRGDREVVAGFSDESPALTLVFDRSGRVSVRPEAILADAKVTEIIAALRALEEPGTPIVWRAVIFASAPVEGWWRYRDEWQIVPLPASAPRPTFLIADHPCLLEVRGSIPPSHNVIGWVRYERRAREIELALRIALPRLEPFPSRSVDHVWVLDTSDNVDVLCPELRQTGYPVPAEVGGELPQEFASVVGITRMPSMDASLYYRRLGIGTGGTLDVPDLLEPFLDAIRLSPPTVRHRFFRAAYWFDRAGAVWRSSRSLSYVSVINSVESLLEDGPVDRCLTCGKDQAPGPTARFREFVERYVGEVPAREELYRLRSKLVHGKYLMSADEPGSFGRFVPQELKERDRHEIALEATRLALIRWLFEQADGTGGGSDRFVGEDPAG